MSDKPLIHLPTPSDFKTHGIEETPKSKPSPKIMARVVSKQKLETSARRELYDLSLTQRVELAIIETPLGYIVVDEDGGHVKMPLLAEQRINVVLFNQHTGRPAAEAPIMIKDLLTFTDRDMSIAEFVSNQDGKEKTWAELVATMVMGGLDTRQDERYRAWLNFRRMILGGSTPVDRSKL